MDELDGAQPHCPNDDIVMRDIAGGWECPECGLIEQTQDVQMPPAFDGPDIHDR